MPIDPEVNAEITALKNKLLKIESDMASLTGKDLAEAQKQISSISSQLAELLKVKNDPPSSRMPRAS